MAAKQKQRIQVSKDALMELYKSIGESLETIRKASLLLEDCYEEQSDIYHRIIENASNDLDAKMNKVWNPHLDELKKERNACFARYKATGVNEDYNEYLRLKEQVFEIENKQE